ncbi:MAG TPA: hypothetical protein EYO33_00835, partial [Phycisphaerales bacterium]|nr:hypothetical protein [Phycisphaerales bacterium]
MPTIQTGIFSRASANSSSSKLVAQKTASHQLAQSLQVDPGEVTIRDSQTKMMNLSTLGFPVEGELQMSAAGQAVEVKMSVGEEKFVFRGNGESGRLGLDVEHDGFWSKDERGIYT